MTVRSMSRLDKFGLATRLMVLVLLAVFLATSIGGWALRERLHTVVERGFEAQVKDRLERLLLQFEVNGVHAARSDRIGQGDFGRIFSGWYWVVLQHGQTQHSRSSWDSPLDPTNATDLHGDQRIWTLIDPTGRPLLGLSRAVVLEGRPAVVYVFGPMDETLTEWALIDRVLLVTQLLTLLGLALLAVVAVRWGLVPLRRLQTHLQRVNLGQAPRVGSGFGTDLDPLAATLSDVLSRNAEVVARAQHQAADLSHALKKPLALMALEARKETVSGSWVQSQVRTLSHTIDRHLARVGSGVGSQEPVSVCAVLHRILSLMWRLHADRGLYWGTVGSALGQTPAAQCPVWRGNVADLEEMLGNLLDNAGKWATTRVEVGVEYLPAQATRSAAVLLWVADDGPGLSGAQLAQVAQRGQRFDQAVPGHGLGLAIVRDLAEAHQGQLNLSTNSMGGLRCELLLPLL